MRLLVAGANGQVGQCLVERLKERAFIWEAHGRATLDIADESSVAAHMARFQPDIVINAAAYTSVDKAEQEPERAARGNSEGPAVLARHCQQAGSALLHISTDYVFSGDAEHPYSLQDAVGPTGVYGQTKLDGERNIQRLCERHVILRTAWVFSEHGNNFMKTMLRLARERDQLRIVDDQQGSPTYAGDIADALLQIANRLYESSTPSYGLYHFAGDDPVTWCDFARYIIGVGEREGLIASKPTISGISTTDFPTPAKRPMYSVLDSSALFEAFDIPPSDWRKGVDRAIRALR